MPRTSRLLLTVVCAVAVASIYAGQPVLGAMGRDLGISADAVGLIVAVGQLGYIAGLVLMVPLGDLLDRRRLIAAHLVLVAAGLTMAAIATVAWLALCGLAAAGFFAVVVQITVAYTASTSPLAERGRNLGVVTSGVVVGILGARVLAGLLAGPVDTWMSRLPHETDGDRDVRMRGALPIGRVASTDEVAAAVLWLASPESSYAVGHDLVLDGGATLS